MIRCSMALAILAASALLAPSAHAQNENQGQGRAIVTVLPKKATDPAPATDPQGIKLEINGKKATVSNWRALNGPNDTVELIFLMDSSSRDSLGGELETIAHFLDRLPPNTRATIAYMQNGSAVLSGPLTADRAEAKRHLHMPMGVSSASPYFCLSNLAQHWPSGDRHARREVVMVTDGVDPYEQHLDLDDPYVKTATDDSARAGILVYTLYWRNRGPADNYAEVSNTGQSLLEIVAEATGGKSYWHGQGNPVSFEPYLDDLARRLQNQYELGFSAPLHGKPKVEELRLKFSVPGSSVDSPQLVMVYREGATQ